MGSGPKPRVTVRISPEELEQVRETSQALGLTSGEIRAQRRTGEPPWAAQMRFSVYKDFRDAESWGDLEARLRQHGLALEKRGRGLVVTDGERQLKISRIHRGRSTAKLEKRFGLSFDDWRGRVSQLRETVETFRAAIDLARRSRSTASSARCGSGCCLSTATASIAPSRIGSTGCSEASTGCRHEPSFCSPTD